jgi:hypothetical protein
MHGARFKEHAKTDVRTRLYQFEKDTRQIWVCWSMFENADILLSAGGPVTLVNVVGGERTLTPLDGKITVSVGEMPVYFVADKAVLSSVSEIARKDQVIADSESEFGGPEVSSAWSYFYVGNNKTGTAAYDPGQVKPMSWLASPGDWDDLWSGPGKYFCVSAGGAHPATLDGGQGWAIRRWTSTVDGRVHVMIKTGTGAQGDGCGFKVFIDGEEAYSKLLGPKSKDAANFSPVVKKGARIDFITTPGEGTDTNYDSAGFRIQVLTP